MILPRLSREATRTRFEIVFGNNQSAVSSLQAADEEALTDATAGALDLTVGPLLRVWGLDAGAAESWVPTDG